MSEDIGRSLGTDYFLIRDQLRDEEIDYLERTRAFVDEDVLPVAAGYWERGEFPWELLEKMAPLGIVGDGIVGYGCPPMSPIACGLINMELNRGDGSLGTFLGVQAGLAMRSIALLGSEAQKQRWLAPMARLEKIGAFALTEPEHGSDSAGLETTARRQGEEYVIDGEKRWIGNGTIADVLIVWARAEDDEVNGFLVDKDTPGLQTSVIGGKASVRAMWQADIKLSGVRVAANSRLPDAKTFQDTGRVLAETRNACAWSALGHAVGAYEVALTHARRRHQFGKPLVSFQLVQGQLVKMLADVTSMQLYCLRLGRLIEEGKMTESMAALAKMNNTRRAREVIASARDVLGGDGILLDRHVMRHYTDIEAIYTYEGTESIQTLIVGRDITGVSAFV